MKWLVGLGNPGARYADTRHNIGWLALDQFAIMHSLPTADPDPYTSSVLVKGVVSNQAVTLVYPQIFMNHSGRTVARLVPAAERGEQLVIVHDEIDLPFGTVKVVFDRGPSGHNGVASIITTLGTQAFVRVRIGIAPASKGVRPVGGGPLERYVLGQFSPEEQAGLPAVLERASAILTALLTQSAAEVMNEFN